MIADALDRRLSSAGVGLGELSIEWGRRPAIPPACQITDRDRRILALIHDFGYMTTGTLAGLAWGYYGSQPRARLKVLHDAGYLDKLRPRVARTQGTREWIYRLTEPGWRLLLDSGLAADGEDYAPAALTSIAYVEHDVQVAALVTRLAAAAAHAIGATGPLLDAAPFALLGPRASAVERCGTQSSSVHSATEIGDRQIRLESATPGRIDPDATLLGTTRDGERTAVMIEYDRTRRAAKMEPKLRRYDFFLSSGWRETRYAGLDIEPAVLVVCASDRQIGAFRARADLDLSAWIGGRRADRRNSEHPGREQVGFTSRARLLSGDWRIEQVPALPPELRQPNGRDSAASRPRGTVLDLATLFAAKA